MYDDRKNNRELDVDKSTLPFRDNVDRPNRGGDVCSDPYRRLPVGWEDTLFEELRDRERGI